MTLPAAITMPFSTCYMPRPYRGGAWHVELKCPATCRRLAGWGERGRERVRFFTHSHVPDLLASIGANRVPLGADDAPGQPHPGSCVGLAHRGATVWGTVAGGGFQPRGASKDDSCPGATRTNPARTRHFRVVSSQVEARYSNDYGYLQRCPLAWRSPGGGGAGVDFAGRARRRGGGALENCAGIPRIRPVAAFLGSTRHLPPCRRGKPLHGAFRRREGDLTP